MTAKHSEKLIGVQFGRAVAAIMVVLYHGGRMLPQYLGNIGLARNSAFGNAGVDFFFVLSGFIIYYVHRDDINNPSRLSHYIFRRLTRIYPIYWVVTLLGIAVFAAKKDWVNLAPLHVMASLLLIPEAQMPIVGVAWTLCHEMLFYMAFATLIYSSRIGFLAITIWTSIVVIGVFAPHNGTLIHFVEDPYHIEFAFGAFAAYATRACPVRTAPAFAICGIIAFLIIGGWFNDLSVEYKLVGRMMYGLSSTCIIYGLAVGEARGIFRFPSWAAYLGAASYSIYLIHTFLLGWIGKAIAKVIQEGSAPSLLYLLAACGAVAGGCALYRFVEKPLQAVVRNNNSMAPVFKQSA